MYYALGIDNRNVIPKVLDAELERINRADDDFATNCARFKQRAHTDLLRTKYYNVPCRHTTHVCIPSFCFHFFCHLLVALYFKRTHFSRCHSSVSFFFAFQCCQACLQHTHVPLSFVNAMIIFDRKCQFNAHAAANLQ